MAETLTNQTDTRFGRGGLLVPETGFSGDAHPRTVAEFLNRLWLINGIDCYGAEQNAMDFGAAYNARELVIPAAGKHPVSVLRYSYMPPESNYDSPAEKYSVLVPPQTVGDFQPVFTAAYRPRPSMGSAEDRDSLFVEHSLGSVAMIIKENYERYGDYGQQQARLLGLIMREIVDFISC